MGHKRTIQEGVTLGKTSDILGFLAPSYWELPVCVAWFVSEVVAPFQQKPCTLLSFLVMFSSVMKG